jgi:hemolysin activation/secretion protein
MNVTSQQVVIRSGSRKLSVEAEVSHRTGENFTNRALAD